MPAKKGHITTEKTKQKIRLSLLGRKHSPERIEKMRQSKRGKKWTKKNRLSHINCHSGEKHYNWKGGRRIDLTNGYVVLYQKGKHPKREHRIIVSKILGRVLKDTEVIHYINGNPKDNNPKNLYLFKNNKSHLEFHRKLKNNPNLELKSNIV